MPDLELDRLDKSYGELRALRELSLTAHAGEILGFVGSNEAARPPRCAS